MNYPNLVLTFLIEYENKFLIIERDGKESNFPRKWEFPGEKVEENETIVDTIRRGVLEETNLEIYDDFCLLDAYSFEKSSGGYTTGLAFLIRAKSNKVIPSPNEFGNYRWVSSLEEISYLERIAGIDNHLVAAQKALKRGIWQSLEELQLSEDKYLNK